MRRLLFAVTLPFWLSPQTVCAQNAHLAWDNCPAEGGTQSRVSPCDTNSGSHTLVVSFTWNSDDATLTGMDLDLELYARDDACGSPCNRGCPINPLPNYWLSCRSSAISVSTDFTGPPFSMPSRT